MTDHAKTAALRKATPADDDRVRIRISVVEDANGCWIWQKAISIYGYGLVHRRKNDTRGKRLTSAHRFAYEAFVGPIPSGLTIDHLCRVRACVNPLHLEPVTMRENSLRGIGPSAQNARKLTCPRGHVFDKVAAGKRACTLCHSIAGKLRRAASSASYKPMSSNSGFRNVSFNRRRQGFIAYLTIGGVRRDLGLYQDPLFAAAVVSTWRVTQ